MQEFLHRAIAGELIPISNATDSAKGSSRSPRLPTRRGSLPGSNCVTSPRHDGIRGFLFCANKADRYDAASCRLPDAAVIHLRPIAVTRRCLVSRTARSTPDAPRAPARPLEKRGKAYHAAARYDSAAASIFDLQFELEIKVFRCGIGATVNDKSVACRIFPGRLAYDGSVLDTPDTRLAVQLLRVAPSKIWVKPVWSLKSNGVGRAEAAHPGHGQSRRSGHRSRAQVAAPRARSKNMMRRGSAKASR